VLEFGRKRIIVDSITNKKELKMAKQIKSTKIQRGLPRGAKVAIAVGAMGAATLFGAYENETNSTPKVCECPNGTVHNNFGCECGGEDCTCTHTIYRSGCLRRFGRPNKQMRSICRADKMWVE
jgi:hypothetical protein